MFNFDALLPPGLTLFDYQTVGVATALLERRTILADEPGLGKSAEAMVALEAAGAFPAVVVCPASLKDNWAGEFAQFLPHRKTVIASGRPYDWRSADVLIVSHSSLANWLPRLCDLKAVVLDESHAFNSRNARRSRAALSLTQRVPEDGLVLNLTGTPFLNKPAEIIAQLRLVGRLGHFADTPDAFRATWCGDDKLPYLHRALTQVCYVRRQRKDVLGRNETRRIPVKLSIEGSLDEYREAERDLVSYLLERNGLEVAAKAANAQSLSRLATLRKLLGEAKLWDAKRWIDRFLTDNPTRSLVVFAYHRLVQEGLVAHYGCAHILGGERDVEDQKRKFQSGEQRLIVVSLTAGREGHTLTKASDVLFVELGWTPGGMQQAEDRCNRLTQTEDNVFAWYLLAAGTLDESIWRIVERKRKLFLAAAEGRTAPTHDSDLTTAVEVLDGYRSAQPQPSLRLVKGTV